MRYAEKTPKSELEKVEELGRYIPVAPPKNIENGRNKYLWGSYFGFFRQDGFGNTSVIRIGIAGKKL